MTHRYKIGQKDPLTLQPGEMASIYIESDLPGSGHWSKRQRLYRRTPEGVWQVREQRDIDRYIREIDAFIEMLNTTRVGLIDARMEIEADEEYGSPTVNAWVSGWRDATEAEIEQFHTTTLEAVEQEKQRVQRQLDDMKAKFPDQFKD